MTTNINDPLLPDYSGNSPPQSRKAPKATRQEVERRVVMVMKMIVQRNLRPTIHRYMRQLCDARITEHTCDLYIERARHLLRERYLRTENGDNLTPDQVRDLHKMDAFGLYESIIRDPESTNGIRLAAQDRINTMLGLNAPLKIAATDPSGEHEALAHLREASLVSEPARALLALMAERAAGLPDALPSGQLPENSPPPAAGDTIDAVPVPPTTNGEHRNGEASSTEEDPPLEIQ